MKLYAYSKCGTCRNAIKWLKDNGFEFEIVPIELHSFSFEEMNDLYTRSTQPLTELFNRSGQVYRDLKLKDTLKHMDEKEAIETLIQSSMLVKRPVLVSQDIVCFGFKQDVYESLKHCNQ